MKRYRILEIHPFDSYSGLEYVKIGMEISSPGLEPSELHPEYVQGHFLVDGDPVMHTFLAVKAAEVLE